MAVKSRHYSLIPTAVFTQLLAEKQVISCFGGGDPTAAGATLVLT